MNFELTVTYEYKVYVKVSEVIKSYKTFKKSKQELKSIVDNKAQTIKGLGRTKWVLLSFVEELLKQTDDTPKTILQDDLFDNIISELNKATKQIYEDISSGKYDMIFTDNSLTKEEIDIAKKIKRQLIKLYHPDISKSDTAKELVVINKIFKEV